MVRTALLSVATALGLTLPAVAQPPVPQRYPSYAPTYPSRYYPPGRPSYRPPISIDYRVMYRTCSHDRWRTYGTFDSRYRAERTASQLRYRGYEVQVATW